MSARGPEALRYGTGLTAWRLDVEAFDPARAQHEARDLAAEMRQHAYTAFTAGDTRSAVQLRAMAAAADLRARKEGAPVMAGALRVDAG